MYSPETRNALKSFSSGPVVECLEPEGWHLAWGMGGGMDEKTIDATLHPFRLGSCPLLTSTVLLAPQTAHLSHHTIFLGYKPASIINHGFLRLCLIHLCLPEPHRDVQ